MLQDRGALEGPAWVWIQALASTCWMTLTVTEPQLSLTPWLCLPQSLEGNMPQALPPLAPSSGCLYGGDKPLAFLHTTHAPGKLKPGFLLARVTG